MRYLIGILLSVWCVSITAADRSCVVPDQRVIDTDYVPEYQFTGQESSADLLPVYCLGADTWLFMGSIEQLSAQNRGFNGNAGFIVTPEGVLVIDVLGTPLLGRRMIATIRSITDQPIRYVIVTHNHPDHYYGIQAFEALPEVEVIAHAGIEDYLFSERMEDSVAYRRDLLARDMQGFKAVGPDNPLSLEPYQAMSLILGGRRFEIYNAGRHHSDGDLVVYQVDDGIIWVSDLVFNQRVTFIGDGHSDQAIEAMEWLGQRAKNAGLMVPGHGSAQTPPFPMLQQTKEYIGRLRQVMTQAIEEDVDLSDALDQAEFDDWRDVRLYQENHRANGSFIYRELEMELF
jgi:glyoxylase-like metal-dependent hydrolase (beta-lactamase superfamily II)